VIPDTLCADCCLIDVRPKKSVQGLSKVGPKAELLDVGAAEATPEEMRNRYPRNAETVPGLSDALVPTLEEKVVTEHLPAAEHMDGLSIEENPEKDEQENAGIAGVEAKVGDGQIFGAPVDGSSAPEMGDQPPHARMGKNDADAEEQKALRARAILRKHLNTRSSHPTPPTPRPEYAADSFEDPICDKFWKGIWVACAVHNVSICAIPELRQRPMCSCYSRPRSSVAFSMPYRTTLLRLGSSTRTLSHITTVCSSQYAIHFFSDLSILNVSH
jgi:phospholipase D1/2